MPVNPDIIFILFYFQKKVYRQSAVLCFVYKTGLFFLRGIYSNWEAYSR